MIRIRRKPIQVIENDKQGCLIGPFKSAEQAERIAQSIEQAALAWKTRLGLATAPLEAIVDDKIIRVIASGATGVVPIEGYDVTIIPKYLSHDPSRSALWGQALLGMLSYSASNRFILEKDVTADSARELNFVDLIGSAYARALSTALEEGIPRGYTRLQKWQPTLRGRLISERLYPQLLIAPDQLPCEYACFTTDTPTNRLLKWAALQFATIVSRGYLADRLMNLAALMSGVQTSLPPLLMLERLKLSPQYRHCEPAMRLALWLAHSKGGQMKNGNTALPGILLDSAMVYEDFIIAALRRCCTFKKWGFRRTRLSLAKPLTTGRGIESEPDAQIWEGNTIIAVADAKYKKWRGAPTAENAYQVMADARLLSCKRAILVYPSPAANCHAPIHWRLQAEGNPMLLSAIFVDPLRVSEKAGFLSIVNGIVADIEQSAQISL